MERDPVRAGNSHDMVALTAGRDWRKLAELALAHGAKAAVIADESVYAELKAALEGTGIAVSAGPAALVEVAAMEADLVVAAIVGAATDRDLDDLCCQMKLTIRGTER